MVTVCVRFEVSLGAVPLLARALENYPDDPELQVLSTPGHRKVC